MVKGGKAGVGPLVLPLGGGCRRGGGHYFLQLDAGVLARLDISALTLDPQMHPLNDASDTDGDDQQNDHHHCRYGQIVCILHCKNKKKYYYLYYLIREREREREREIQCLCSNLFFNHALQIQTTHVLRKIIYKNNNQHAPMLMQKNELVTCITN